MSELWIDGPTRWPSNLAGVDDEPTHTPCVLCECCDDLKFTLDPEEEACDECWPEYQESICDIEDSPTNG